VHEPSADEAAIQNSGFKTPWWSFSGLFIIIVLIIFGYMSDASTKKEHDAFKENPTLGVSACNHKYKFQQSRIDSG
jgi:hypothetical protein